MIILCNAKSVLITLTIFTVLLLASCGGGGGGGGGSTTPSSPTPAIPFTLTTIDNSVGDVGWYSSLSMGSLHIAYYDSTNVSDGDLKYATCDNVTVDCTNAANWSTDTADNSTSVGEYSSIAYANSNAHISYYDFGNKNLIYMTGTFGSFSKATVDNDTDIGKFTSIAVESAGNVHIGYYDVTNGNLKYATCSSNCDQAVNWNTETVDSSSDFNGYISLALNSSTVHISYRDITNGNLMYTTGTFGAFISPVTVDNSALTGLYSSLAVETDGTVHISYYDNNNGYLRYTTCSASCTQAVNWSNENVDTSANVGEHTSIAVESDGTVHISYHDIDNDRLKYATGTAGSFTTEVVDTTASQGEFSSIEVEADGTVHISYYDYIGSGSGSLKYATR